MARSVATTRMEILFDDHDLNLNEDVTDFTAHWTALLQCLNNIRQLDCGYAASCSQKDAKFFHSLLFVVLFSLEMSSAAASNPIADKTAANATPDKTTSNLAAATKATTGSVNNLTKKPTSAPAEKKGGIFANFLSRNKKASTNATGSTASIDTDAISASGLLHLNSTALDGEASVENKSFGTNYAATGIGANSHESSSSSSGMSYLKEFYIK